MEYLNSKVNHHDYMFDHIGWGVDVCKRVDSPRVGILFDIYHAQILDGDVVRNIRDTIGGSSTFIPGGNPGRHDMDADQRIELPIYRAGNRRQAVHGLGQPRDSPAQGRDLERRSQGRSRNLHRVEQRVRVARKQTVHVLGRQRPGE